MPGLSSDSCREQILAPAQAAMEKWWAYFFSCELRPSQAVRQSSWHTGRSRGTMWIRRENGGLSECHLAGPELLDVFRSGGGLSSARILF